MSVSSHLTGVSPGSLAWQLLRMVPEAVFLVDPESLIIRETNVNAERLTGRLRDELANLPFSEWFTAPDDSSLSALLQIVDGSSTVKSAPLPVQLRFDINRLPPLAATGYVLETDGQPIGMITVGPASPEVESSAAALPHETLPLRAQTMAIPSSVSGDRQLENAREQFRYLFDHSPDAIFVESLEGTVLDANKAACSLHKLSREQLIGQDALALVPPDDRDAASHRLKFLATGEISEFESRSLRSDGLSVPVGIRISTISYDGKQAVLLHVRDITQQKNDEVQKREHDRQLAHVSRLTMMGQLVAGIAHEIRQPLWSLSTFADVCVESLSRPDYADRLPKIREVASKVVSEARRVNAITTRMLSFARNGVPERTTCNIAEIANDAIELTAGRARSSRIKTTLRLDDELPLIQCDRVLIEQTFANLLNNAYEVLSVHLSDAREVIIEITRHAEDRNFISTSVRDNGPGLSEGVLPEQLFEGFFTTGQSGLGIGLALSRSFVEDHGGIIWASQLPGGGMEFVFTLRVDGGKQGHVDRFGV
ncbi:MAG: PAS domain S-box protein [Rhodopirellula sp.]|nr:PAS domain S-box protein [Rhodopirellula sp.]